jgi:pyruvate oxidase
MARFRCTVCNWMYDEEAEGVPFADLPDTWTCPRCGAPKSAFVPKGLVKETDEQVRTTVADKVVEQLVALGVKHVYGIPGDSNLPLADAIRRNDNIRFILTRHEETAAFMASAHGKMTDHIGVCMSIAGPGATNLITGLMDASADRAPVLALVGQVAEVFLGSEAFQEIDQLELFHPFTDFAETIARPNQALKLATLAAKHAYRGPGVAALSTPTDVLGERLAGKLFPVEKRVFGNPTAPEDEKLKHVAGLVNDCRRTVVIAGWGCRHYGEELLAFANKIHAAIATTSRAKGTIDEADEVSLGVLGSIGSHRAARAIQKAELILILGTGFRHANLTPPGVKIIQVDTDPARIGRTFDIDAGLVGDAGIVLRRLTELADEKKPDEEFWKHIREQNAIFHEAHEKDAKDLSTPVNPGYVIRTLNRLCAQDAIITVDVGDHTYWFYKRFQCTGQRCYLSANIASMGFGLPAALAAQLDFPDRQVVCVTGDGGFGMLMADFTTAVREKLPINVIVFNDGKLKNIKKELERDGYPEFGVSFPNPDFARFAETSGGIGFRVEDPHELEGALKQAFASDKPAVIDVLIDPAKMAAATRLRPLPLVSRPAPAALRL